METKTSASVNRHPILPEEILIEIFSTLSAIDRKAVRLVCRQWYQICKAACIQDKEKFFIHAFHSMETILKVLQSFNRDRMNLQFYRRKNLAFTLEFWTKCGPNITALVLYDCKAENGTMESIVRNCPNLSSLVWYNLSDSFTKIVEGVLFQKLVDENVVRNKLEYLTIEAEIKKTIPKNFLTHVFLVFPNMVKFVVCCDCYGYAESNDDFIIQFEKLYSQNAANFRKIFLKFHHRPHQAEKYFSSAALKNLQIMQMKIYLNDRADDGKKDITINEHIRSIMRYANEHVEILRCELQAYEYSNADVLTAFLNKCPNLRRLWLKENRAFVLCDMKIHDRKFMEKLLKSSLEELTISVRYFKPDVVRRGDLPSNYTIRCLVLGYMEEKPRGNRDISYTVHLLQSLKNLEHLRLFCVDNMVLNHIVKFQTKLKTLWIYGNEFEDSLVTLANNGAFVGKHHLNDLSLLMFDCFESPIAEKFFDHVSVPNLKFLVLADVSRELISNLSNYVPNLEFLFINWPKPSNDVLLSSLTRLKKIKFVFIDCKQCQHISGVEFERIFQKCPSLRLFSYVYDNTNIECSYDLFLGKVIIRTIDLQFPYDDIPARKWPYSYILQYYSWPNLCVR